jgi:hypothetical protein
MRPEEETGTISLLRLGLLNRHGRSGFVDDDFIENAGDRFVEQDGFDRLDTPGAESNRGLGLPAFQTFR